MTDLPPLRGARAELCSVEGCGRNRWARGMCLMHYKRVWRGGTAGGGNPSRARAYGSLETRFLRSLRQEGDCLVCTLRPHGSMGYRSLIQNGVHLFAHRYAWERVHGVIPEGLVVRHTCHNPPCCNIEHLKLGTHADNSRDMVEAGRQSRGERHSAILRTRSLKVVP